MKDNYLFVIISRLILLLINIIYNDKITKLYILYYFSINTSCRVRSLVSYISSIA